MDAFLCGPKSQSPLVRNVLKSSGEATAKSAWISPVVDNIYHNKMTDISHLQLELKDLICLLCLNLPPSYYRVSHGKLKTSKILLFNLINYQNFLLTHNCSVFRKILVACKAHLSTIKKLKIKTFFKRVAKFAEKLPVQFLRSN